MSSMSSAVNSLHSAFAVDHRDIWYKYSCLPQENFDEAFARLLLFHFSCTLHLGLIEKCCMI